MLVGIKWQPLLYRLDRMKCTGVINTDHLSNVGVYEVLLRIKLTMPVLIPMFTHPLDAAIVAVVMLVQGGLERYKRPRDNRLPLQLLGFSP
jgi:hypothetical protein